MNMPYPLMSKYQKGKILNNKANKLAMLGTIFRVLDNVPKNIRYTSYLYNIINNKPEI